MKLRARCYFIETKNKLHDDIDWSMLITELGGEVAFDSSAWVNEQKEREMDGTLFSMTDIMVVKA